MFIFKLIMFFKYLHYKRKGYIPVFGMGFMNYSQEVMNYTNCNPDQEFLMPNGRLANCKLIKCYKNTTGNIIQVIDKDSSIFGNQYQEYFYIYNFYNYIDTPQIYKCSFKQFVGEYSSLLFSELDEGEFKVINALTNYSAGFNTDAIIGVWTRQCEKKWGGK